MESFLQIALIWWVLVYKKDELFYFLKFVHVQLQELIMYYGVAAGLEKSSL